MHVGSVDPLHHLIVGLAIVFIGKSSDGKNVVSKNRIHLDDDFARGVGLPGRIVHGLCTMAFAGRAVLEAAGIDEPQAVTRIAVRFSAPLFPGESLTTRVWKVDGAFGFESVNEQGMAVLKDGRLELR